MEPNRITPEQAQGPSDCRSNRTEWQPEFTGGGIITTDTEARMPISIVPSNEFIVWKGKDGIYDAFWDNWCNPTIFP